MKKKGSTLAAIILSAGVLFYSATLLAQSPPPKLIVQIVIDQLRGDLIEQYRHQFGPNGFNYLLTHGINYTNAHHPQANTVTCVGHANISTGSYPALHGIISNEWYDKTTHRNINCVEDPQNPILVTARSKIRLPGRSPIHLIPSTLSDELVLVQRGRAFSVAFKDRSAIMLAGHAGRAFWFDIENGGFITSQHYYSRYPTWVTEWNTHYQPKNEIWSLSKPLADYRYAQITPYISASSTFGKTFPHQTGSPLSAGYYKSLASTPFSDRITADFAITLLNQEKLGHNPGKTDYLAISFPAVDTIGHHFGPNSIESEDNLLKLDETLTYLLAALNKEIGLANTLIILTADHGVNEGRDYLKSHHMITKNELNSAALKKQLPDLLNQLHLPLDCIEAIEFPYLYLNHQLIKEHHLTIQTVRTQLATVLQQQPGLFRVFTLPVKTPSNWLTKKVNAMYFPTRVGDLYLIGYPYQTLNTPGAPYVTHGSPWNYDSYVPLLFVNSTFQAQRITSLVSTTDIAPTLSTLLGIRLPSATVGKPLVGVTHLFKESE